MSALRAAPRRYARSVHYVGGPGFSAAVIALVMLLAAVLTQAAAAGKITRNGLWGIRIPSTMASDAAWLAGHRAARLPIWVGFAAVAIGAVLAQFVWQASIVTYALFAIFIVWTLIAANRAARETVSPVD